MARPRKSGLDYFPHDVDALSDEKVEALRALYGNDGYAFYFILLERIYRTDNGELDISDAETSQILARKVGVDVQKFEQMIQTALKRGAFDRQAYENGVLTSAGIKRRRAPVLAKRQTMRADYQRKVSETETPPETRQRKAQESREKKAKQPIEPSGLKTLSPQTITAVRAQLVLILSKAGYWNETKVCQRRLEGFVGRLVIEAKSKDDPPAWLSKAARERIRERLDDFKPAREELDRLERSSAS